MAPELRWRMQSLRTGWGIEAPFNEEGRKKLLKIRRTQRDKFKWCRVYAMQQMFPEIMPGYFTPFRLTHRQYS